MDRIIQNIHKSLRTVVSQFYYRPHLFFNEIGFHNYCFAVFYRNPVFTKVYKTKDGKDVNILHPEYGSVLRKKGKERAWYDMVVLNPEFIKNNEYNRVANNNILFIEKTGYKNNDVLGCFEFKFIKHRSKGYVAQLKKDYESLKNAVEAVNKYMIVFSTLKDDLNYFEDMNWNNGIKLIYSRVYFDNNKKQVEIISKPNNLLNLPKNWLT